MGSTVLLACRYFLSYLCTDYSRIANVIIIFITALEIFNRINFLSAINSLTALINTLV